MKYKIFMKFTVIISAAVIILASSGCGKQATSSGGIVENNGIMTRSDLNSDLTHNTSEPSEKIQDFGQDVVAVVGGEEVKISDVGYYIYNNAVITINKMNGAEQNNSENTEASNVADDISKFNWNGLDSDGRTYKENVTRAALDDAINDIAFRQMAEKRGYSAANAKSESSKLIDDAISANGAEKILTNASMLGISDIDTYKNIYTNIAVFEGVAKEFYSNPKKYVDDIEILAGFSGTKGVTVQSILIMDDTAKGQADIIAREAVDKAKSGQDFVRLMNEYNEDTGEDESGYTFPEGELQSDFESAAFSLGIGEVSNIIRSEYGYYIIKRIAGAYELQNYWRSISDVSIAPNAYDLISFDEVINMISAASLN